MTAWRYEVRRTATLPAARRAAVAALFDATYAEADQTYLAAAMRQLRLIALACDDAERLIGFALGDARLLDLPRLPGTVVRMAGIACVDAAWRRRGVMSALAGRAMLHELPDRPGGLATGRMAHPATFRLMGHLPGAVPQVGRVPSEWHRAIAVQIAAAYGATAFDPATFVCRGRGRPIGIPRVTIEASAAEWALFAPVDRSRGDSLLGFAWMGEPPPGW